MPSTATVALTFDDGPDSRWTPQVLDALSRHGATATFFVMGPCASAHPSLIRRACAEGHEIALHAERHTRHSELGRDEIARDVVECLQRLAELGVQPTRWRTPWGVRTLDTEAVAGHLGLELCGWTADSRDWTGDSADRMLSRCRPALDDGGVVLMHDGLGPGATRDGCEQTVELASRLAEMAAERGLRARALEAR